MMIGLLATMSFNLVDTYFVSGLGKDSLAALSFTFPIIMLVFSISIGLGAGTSSVVSRAVGEKDEQAVKELVTDSILLSMTIVGVVSIIGLLTIEPVFRMLGAGDDVLPLVKAYMYPWFIGAVPMAVPMVVMSSFRAMGNTKLQGVAMIAMAVVNAILDPILIYGWWIFPRMEIQGAAVASLVVRLCGLLLIGYWLVFRYKLLVNPFNGSRIIRSWQKILHIGIPATATNIIIPASSAVIVGIVATHGNEAVAGFGAAVRVEAISLICFYALSAVIGPFCGQNLGASEFERLFRAQKVCAKVCLSIGLSVTVILALFGAHVGRIFSANPEVIEVVRFYLLIVPISYSAYGIVMVVNASFNGLGLPIPGVLLSSTRVILLLLPLAWLGNMLLGLYGVFISITLSNIIVGTWAYFWVNKTIHTLVKPATV
ncbi:MATE family efflux transporter [Teredinibacter sp. KSP-S5-2]|uniref:MATE family efflux transporter n=1 Tax=Teredinibacter sp. KSP-S5-2 TaxID=3034506 RepID=UPI00293433D7|nr:MATE family efflux transporter [Teredinibacter sp. KSP-S5-2]WNO08098.1 MATE family efflux transporter [Teredinibacter sp. KSP-S5-2]